MTVGKGVLFGVLLVAAAVLQVTAVNRMPLPGAHPDLLLVVVVACALTGGPLAGLVTGFCAGLLADVVPPADHTLGRLAIVLALAGYGAGMLEDVEERSVLAPVVVVLVATVGVVGLYAALGALLGDPGVHWPTVGRRLPTALLYDAVLTPFVVPLVAAAARRLGPPGAAP